MDDTHGWHLFDAVRGYEVRRLDADVWELRWTPEGEAEPRTRLLDAAEFEELRSIRPNPQAIP